MHWLSYIGTNKELKIYMKEGTVDEAVAFYDTFIVSDSSSYYKL